MREGHHLELKPLQPGPELLLMAWMAMAVQQHHGAAGQTGGPSLADALLQGSIKHQWLQFGPIGGQAPTHLDHGIKERGGPVDRQGEQIRTGLIANAEGIAKSPVDQQQGGRPPALQQGIGGHGGAKAHLGDRPIRQGFPWAETKQVADGANGWISGPAGLLRQHFAQVQLTGRRAGHQIGEGAPPIDPEAPASRRRCACFRGFVAPLLGHSRQPGVPQR